MRNRILGVDMNMVVILAFLVFSMLASVMGAPQYVDVSQVAPDNVVYITSESVYCMIMPRFPHTNIGDSEYPGGMQTFCSYPYDASQGWLPPNFWRNVSFVQGTGVNGARMVQLTGCINPWTIDRLNPADFGGQYDSHGGIDLQGNPRGSRCLGYQQYVELVEPAGPRACIRCCDDPADCPLVLDTAGCARAIPGNYFDCGYLPIQ
ncbi:hypothetical protein FRC03_003242 [Tulasnella sp. 419]|nr:hypothetical protein FRC03_003242 [Tulasnella sp. 419]